MDQELTAEALASCGFFEDLEGEVLAEIAKLGRQQSFAAGDGATMRQIVESLLADKASCDRIGGENQELVRRDYSIAAMVDAYRSHYRMLLAE